MNQWNIAVKKWMPWIVLAILVLWVAGATRPPKNGTEFNTREFGQLPVLLNGRIQPFDSVARNSLLAMLGKQAIREKGQPAISANEWLIELMMKPEATDERKVFRIDNPELLGMLSLPDDEKHFAFNQLSEQVEEIETQAKRIREIEAQLRTPFEKQLFKLYNALVLHHQLKNTLRWADSPDFLAEIERYEKIIEPGVRAVHRSEAGQEYDQEAFNLILAFLSRYKFMSQFSYALAVPPLDPEEDRDGWSGVGMSLMETARRGKLDPAVKLYATMAKAYDENQPEVFNLALTEYQQLLEKKGLDREIKKGAREFSFSNFAPFYKSMTLYVLAFMLAAGSWLNWSQWMNRSAFYLILFGLVLHTAGLITRMMLEGRPPVTNLYSSAIFVGWGAVVLGAILERIFRDGIGSVTASSVGFLSLLVAHYLSLDGDTMQMLQAVLDTNFWLDTHVVVITLGYSATFLAGFLAILYIFRGFFTSSLSQAMSKTLGRMVYGIICFALLFSFVGTILGGIWADQSWGRFWGWDPKENGALIIVIWNAVILHARWGGMIRERGLMNMAIFGNIVTSFSWFGTNMLGVGLHSYGFMDQAFFWLMAFVVSQLTIIGLGLVPLRYWASFRPPGGGPGAPPAEPEQRQNIPQSAGT